MSKNNINLAKMIYDAYPHSDLLAIDRQRDCRSLQDLFEKVENEDIGDSLFTFIVVEIVEGGNSSLEGAIKVLKQAKADMDAVLNACLTKCPKEHQ